MLSKHSFFDCHFFLLWYFIEGRIKKVIVVVCLLAFVVGCGNNSSKETNSNSNKDSNSSASNSNSNKISYTGSYKATVSISEEDYSL